jgi:hypothetical protein
MRVLVVLAVLIEAVAAGQSSGVTGPTKVGTVEHLEGLATVMQEAAGARSTARVNIGDDVSIGDTIATEAESHVRVALSVDAAIAMPERSRLRIGRADGQLILKLESGSLYYRGAGEAGGAFTPPRIETGSGSAHSRGGLVVIINSERNAKLSTTVCAMEHSAYAVVLPERRDVEVAEGHCAVMDGTGLIRQFVLPTTPLRDF